MDIGKSFTFVFEDENWITNILIGAAILAVGLLFSWLIIPIFLAFLVLNGYAVAIIRRVLNGQADGLPQWDNWGGLLMDGLKMWVIGFVYALPIIIASFCMIVPAAALGDSSETAAAILMAIFGCLIILWSIILTIMLPAAIAFWVATDELSAAFRFGDVLAFVRENLSTYLITFVMTWVAAFVGQLGSLVCGVGLLATLPYSYMVIGHLFGQAYMVGQGQPLQPSYDEGAI